MINLRLKEIELENFDFKIDKRRIDSYVNLVSRNKPQELENKLINYNLDFDLFLKEIETELNGNNLFLKNILIELKLMKF